SGSMDARSRPYACSFASGWSPPWNGGIVLTTAAPGAYARTHGPVLENRAVESRSGLRAPTETTGTRLGLGLSCPCPFVHGANAAGNSGRAVASLPAEQTTVVPHLPSRLSRCRSVGS